MMAFIKKSLKIIFLSLAVVMCHLLVISILPYPFNQINIILVFLILLLTIKNQTDILWLAVIIGFLTEPFVAISFGISTLTLTLGIWIAYWLYNNIFIHHSVFLIIVLSALTVFIYRLLFFIIMSGANIIKNKNMISLISWPSVVNFLWEICFTVTILTVLYLIINYFSRLNKVNSASKNFFYERIFR